MKNKAKQNSIFWRKITLLILLTLSISSVSAQCWQTTSSSNNVFAIRANGTLWAWGANSYGQLGIGATIPIPSGGLPNQTTPIQIGTANNWIPVSSTKYHTVVQKNDGTIWTCGANNLGQLGNGTTIPSNILIPVNSTSCSISAISATNDSGTSINGIASTPIINVLSNDNYNNTPANFSNIILSFVNSTNSGITLNTTTGAVNVASTVPVGSYTLTYQICDINNVSNCSTATVTINVNTTAIVIITAVNDSGTTINEANTTAVVNVLLNDTYDSNQATLSNVTLSFVNTTNSGITLNTTTGAVNVASTVPVGNYILTYKICATYNPSNCSTGIVTIIVIPLDSIQITGATTICENTNTTFSIQSSSVPNGTT